MTYQRREENSSQSLAQVSAKLGFFLAQTSQINPPLESYISIEEVTVVFSNEETYQEVKIFILLFIHFSPVSGLNTILQRSLYVTVFYKDLDM